MAAAINQKQAVRAIAAHMPFRAGALSGERFYEGSSTHEGMMSGDAYEQWRADCAAERVTYVVRSYYTPIAWYSVPGGWIVPADKYSVTTSRHQGIVRRAVAEDQAYEKRFAEDLARAGAMLDRSAGLR